MLEIVEYIKARMSNQETGAAAVEYALLVALIAAVIAGVVGGLGTQIMNTFKNVTANV
jgi:Flp pilus assembly pilin Flp